MANRAQEKSVRIVVKAASWRIFATCDTILLSYIITGHPVTALKIGITEVFTKIFLFYLHERYVWTNIKFGRVYAADGITVTGDKHIRSIVKGASWRFFGTLDTIILAWLWTGNPLAALKIGVTEVITKIALFWLHERVWFKIKWGQAVTVAQPVTKKVEAEGGISADETAEMPLAV
ncbi:MAG TPA: DUF2061 domain-containing protein [Chitinophagaceae bacterium]|nr:DUF2061 domain-containing protein [Chitinophagaceae bacterium]